MEERRTVRGLTLRLLAEVKEELRSTCISDSWHLTLSSSSPPEDITHFREERSPGALKTLGTLPWPVRAFPKKIS